jgi:hypothetical protein
MEWKAKNSLQYRENNLSWEKTDFLNEGALFSVEI